MVASRSSKGNLIVAAPLDYVNWNERTDWMLKAFDDYAKVTSEIKGKEFWLTGSVSPTTREKLEKKGWKLHEQCRNQLLNTSN